MPALNDDDVAEHVDVPDLPTEAFQPTVPDLDDAISKMIDDFYDDLENGDLLDPYVDLGGGVRVRDLDHMLTDF